MRPADDWEAGVLIARTTPRERMEVDRGQRWTEYRVRLVHEQETYAWRQAGVINRFAAPRYVVEDRMFETEGDGQPEATEWRLWAFGNTPDEAVDDVIGDSNFREATSLHPLHTLHALHLQRVRAINDAHYQAGQALAAAEEAFDDFKRETNRDFEKKCEGKTPEQAEKVRARMLKNNGATFERLKAEAQQARKAYDAALKEAERVKAVTVRYQPDTD